MDILDEVQERLRDPKYSDHVSRATETELPLEHWYRMDISHMRDCKIAGHAWLESDEAARYLQEHAGECLLVSGEEVVGSGETWDEAYQDARKKGLTRPETLEFRIDEEFSGF